MDTATLKKLFWDVDKTFLSSLSEKAVITRTLSQGTFEDVRKMFLLYGKEKIRTVILSLKESAMTKRRFSYFKLILQ